MTCEMEIDDNFVDIVDNYPDIRTGDLTSMYMYKKYQFIELCNTILYTDDNRILFNAYNKLFTDFRKLILYGYSNIRVSCFEDVIMKMINEEEDGLYERFGVKYSPFQRFVALIAERDKWDNIITNKAKMTYETIGNIKFTLKPYLMMFIDSKREPIKNDFIRNLIHLHFSDL